MKRLNKAGKITLFFMIVYCFVALLAFAISGKATSRTLDGMSGSTLYKICTPKAGESLQAMSAGLCLGYLTAALDILTSGGSVAGRHACPPHNVDEQQIVDITKAYLTSHPESRHLPAYNIVSKAFSDVFPCR